MNQGRALTVIFSAGASVGALAVAVGHDGLWALVLLASVLAGLAEVGSG